MRQKIEEIIRDYLAENLEFISKDLTLISKEYYLPALFGSKGFIDILAKDNFNNFVIIEVKRSEQAARQTINELLKYQGLLKQIHKAQACEIKLVVISTSWNELIIPFSEISKSTYIRGYKIELNIDNIPTAIEEIEPMELLPFERKVSPIQTLELFLTSEKRDSFIEVIKSKFDDLGIDDYLCVEFDSNFSNKKILYPYALTVGFQRQTMSKNHMVLPNLNEELEDIDFDDDEHRLRYIDELILIELESYKYNDTAESGSPEKFTSLLNDGQWELKSIHKHGVFSTDPRMTDSIILNELKGFDGENEIKYLDFTESGNKEKLKKIKSNFKKTLQGNKKLIKHINHIIKTTIKEETSFNLVLEIFYPSSLFQAIYMFYKSKDPNYLPIYNVLILSTESDVIKHYHGRLVWNGEKIKEQELLSILNEDNPMFIYWLIADGTFDKRLLKLMSLKFVNQINEISDGSTSHEQQIIKKNNEFEYDPKKYIEMSSYFNSNSELMDKISIFFNLNTNL